MEKIKLLYLVPHLSTGGMPQFVLKRVESLLEYRDKIEVFLVEYSQFSDVYLVQRNKIVDLLDESHFFSLGWFTELEKKYELIDIIKDNKIDIVHIEEIAEGFESFNRIPIDLLNQLYDNNRTWRIVETCHNIWFDGNSDKKFNPEYYSFVTPYHEVSNFKDTPSEKNLLMYPLEDRVSPILKEMEIYYKEHKVPILKKFIEREKLGIDPLKTHILNVGLWTEGKNQKEGIEVARILQDSHPDLHFHFVGNQAENFESYWGPIIEDLPKNVTIWGERDDVDSFMISCDVMMFNSIWECNPLAIRESISFGLKILTRNLKQYMGIYDRYITPIQSDNIESISKQLLELINSDKTYELTDQNDFGGEHLKLYGEVMKTPIFYNEPLKSNIEINQNFIINPFLEILGDSDSLFNVKFYDGDVPIYETNLKSNHWTKLNCEYFLNLKTEVRENGNLIYQNTINLKNQRVFISFGSKSLGDTLSWIPYCEEFRKKHNCELIVSTFLNDLFIDQYPEIEFVKPGEVVYNIYAQYRLGWFYNEDGTYNRNSHKKDFKTIPLQQTASDILGLDYLEIRPKLNLPITTKKKKVGLGVHSTAQSKYWNNPNGWQEVVNYLIGLGYECVIYSKEGDGYMGNNHPKGATIFEGSGLQSVINDMITCEFFIGLSSGLSWLAWSCELPVVLISGFSEKWTETTLDTYRVINESVCHGCFNTERLDAGDWNWCPFHKGTDRMFECSKQISSDMVIKKINEIIDTLHENDKLIQTMDGFDYSTVNNRCLFDDGVIVDVGCLNWDWSNFFLGKKRVIGVDPFEEQIPFTELFKGVISNYNGTTKMKFSHEASTIINQSEGETVQVRTWKYFCDEYNIKKISVLKINIEGSEYDLLDSLTDDDFDNIDQIAISFHDWMVPEWKSKTEKSIELLKNKNYKITKINNEYGWYLAVKNKSTKDKKIKKLEGFNWGDKEDWYIEMTKNEFDQENIYNKIFDVEEGDVVVDLGGSIGPFTYSILNKNPKKCYVVEPITNQIETLRLNVERSNVKIIHGAITDKKYMTIEWDGVSENVPTYTFREFLEQNNIDKIDFMKCDCEGGEYDIFQPEYINFLKTIPKFVGEFHLKKNDELHNCKFRWFRDNILPHFNKYEVFSLDSVDIKWDLYNEHFLDYYNEVIIYIDNR